VSAALPAGALDFCFYAGYPLLRFADTLLRALCLRAIEDTGLLSC
jgi:hypothetical protein